MKLSEGKRGCDVWIEHELWIEYILHISPPDEIVIEAYIEIISTSDRVEHLCYQESLSYCINVSTGTPRCQISIVV